MTVARVISLMNMPSGFFYIQGYGNSLRQKKCQCNMGGAEIVAIVTIYIGLYFPVKY